MNSNSYVIDNWYWIVTAVASGGFLLWQQLKNGTGVGATPAQAVQMINREKATVIDVREPDEYKAARVVGSKNIPLGELAGAKGLPGNKTLPVVLVCATGARSTKAANQLKEMGYDKAVSLQGGIAAWREANLPLDKG